jgi:hypothetical protein
VNEIVFLLKELGRPQTRSEIAAQLQSKGIIDNDIDFNLNEILSNSVKSGAIVRVPVSSSNLICWRIGAIYIDSNVLVSQLNQVSDVLAKSDDATTFPSSAAKKRPLTSSPSNVSNVSKMNKSSSSTPFKSPFKPVATPKRANVVAATPLVAGDPLAQSIERFLAAKNRLQSLKDRDVAAAKVATTRSTPGRPAENDARLEELIVSWRDACTSAFNELLPRQRHNDTGKPFTRAQLGKALQIEPAHIGLIDWSDDEEEEEYEEKEEDEEGDEKEEKEKEDEHDLF